MEEVKLDKWAVAPYDDTFEKIIETNDQQFCEDKLLEELIELSEVLIKRKNKKGGPKEPPMQDLIDEMGDVELRLGMLMQKMNLNEEVWHRAIEKTDKLIGYYREGKYLGRI